MTRQQQLCNNKWFRLAVSVILTFAVLLVFVFSPFAEAHAVGVLGTELIDIIIAGLSACGITFTTTGGFGSLEDYVSNLLDEYAVDQNTTAIGLLNGSQYGNNKLGQLLLNNRLVRFISAFATYIRARFALANNSNKTIVPANNIGGITLYSLPITTGYYYANISWTYYTIAVNGDANIYQVIETTTLGTSYYICAYSNGPFSVQYTRYRSDQPGQPISTTTKDAEIYNASYFVKLYGYNRQFRDYDNNQLLEYANVTFDQSKDILDGLIASGDEIGVSTGVINPPLDDSDYEDGDGALIDVGSTWGATLKDILDKIRLNWQNVQAGNQDVSIEYAPEKEVGEQLPEQTDIENLPGGTAWNPTDQQLKFFEFESIWHYVAQWIQDFTTGASVVWNTAVQLPSPVVNMVFAMVTLSIIFGVIKVMRA